uniref:Uncharacterized protein n=1 Tax=Utricularia reniformis TaxID=192314 RepID=A0A1Y0B1Q1_9LAMI|nr:hypothetical protein AEK19_MT1090 [Utricularia reniformis]ART31311.1 hypothetical protein AEK19_MT1090 [Utricularia reniformis]
MVLHYSELKSRILLLWYSELRSSALSPLSDREKGVKDECSERNCSTSNSLPRSLVDQELGMRIHVLNKNIKFALFTLPRMDGMKRTTDRTQSFTPMYRTLSTRSSKC